MINTSFFANGEITIRGIRVPGPHFFYHHRGANEIPESTIFIIETMMTNLINW
jgi:hypothetical protein